MKFVIQRVKNASVSIDGSIHFSINKGLLVLFCAECGDENGGEFGGKKLDADGVLTWFANKILKLRIFDDPSNDGKMNLSVVDIMGEILVVSQFTLAANCKKGTRPSYDAAMAPDLAKKMYENFVSILRAQSVEILAGKGAEIPVKTGVFGADMQVSLINDGPVTIILP